MHAIVISGLTPICPGIIGHADLLAAGRSPGRSRPAAADWFDAPRLLGPRGWKYLTASSRYLTAAVRGAVLDAWPAAGDAPPPSTGGAPVLDEGRLPPPERRGVVVGSNFAALAMNRRLDLGLAAAGIDGISPMEAPTFSVNVPASHVSIDCGCRGFNITLTNPVTAGLEALAVGAAAIRRGRAALVVSAAVEEAAPAELGLDRQVAEGACALVLESHAEAIAQGRRPYAVLSRTGDAMLPDRAAAVDVVGGWLASRPVADAPVYVCGPAGREDIAAGIRAACAAAAVAPAPSPFPACHGALAPLVAVAAVAATTGRGLVLAVDLRGHASMVVVDRPDANPVQEWSDG